MDERKQLLKSLRIIIRVVDIKNYMYYERKNYKDELYIKNVKLINYLRLSNKTSDIFKKQYFHNSFK